MHRLSSPAWQARRLKNGPAYTDDNAVWHQYKRFADGAYITGRGDVTAALNARLSPDFVAANAALLQVLYGLKGKPLSKPLPIFQSNEPKQTDLEVWNEIMDELEAQELEAEMQVDTDSSLSWSVSDTDPAEHSLHKPSLDDADEAGEPDEGAPEEREVPSQLLGSVGPPELVNPPELVLQPLKIPAAFTESEMITEFTFALLGHACRLDAVRSTDLSPVLTDALVAQIKEMATVLAHLRDMQTDPLLGPAIKEFVGARDAEIIAAQPKTILQAVVAFEKIVAPAYALRGLGSDYYASLAALQTLGVQALSRQSSSSLYLSALQPLLRAIYQWLAGKPSFIVDVQDCDSWNSFAISLPAFLADCEPLLLNAGKCAWFAARMRLPIYCPRLDLSDPANSLALVCRVLQESTAVANSFMEKVRPLLKETWASLTAVYFAQDPRMREVIYQCLEARVILSEPAGIAERARAQAFLDLHWPQAPFSLDSRLCPVMQTPPVARNVFSIEKLVQLWTDVVAVMASSSASLDAVDLEAYLLETTQRVHKDLDKARGLDPLV